jgi:hypothetical protein
MRSAMQHEKHSSVIAMTSRGRLFVIPRTTKLKDIVSGARWPRPKDDPDVPAFTDLRQTPRRREHEVDGFELCLGYFMELYVIPHDYTDEL